MAGKCQNEAVSIVHERSFKVILRVKKSVKYCQSYEKTSVTPWKNCQETIEN